jgi:hypothetical protein
MRSVLISAAALVALAGSAEAAPKHKWFDLNYATGACDPALLTAAILSRGRERPFRSRAWWDFFTSKDACEKFISDNGIKPQQAPHDDIN